MIGPDTPAASYDGCGRRTRPGKRIVTDSHKIRFSDTRFWVTYRRREYGPFDYEWSHDLAGIELTFAGRKFGEYCSDDEIYADLKEFRLPMRVVEVGSIVNGCVIYGVLNGLSESEREAVMCRKLLALGHGKFAHFEYDRR